MPVWLSSPGTLIAHGVRFHEADRRQVEQSRHQLGGSFNLEQCFPHGSATQRIGDPDSSL
jgi:hypothetical protein